MGAIEKHLLPIGVTVPAQNEVAGGYFIWAQLPEPLSAKTLAPVALRDRGVKVATGDIFQVQGDPSACPERLDRYVRLCFAWEDEEKLAEGVRRFSCAVRIALGQKA